MVQQVQRRPLIVGGRTTTTTMTISSRIVTTTTPSTTTGRNNNNINNNNSNNTNINRSVVVIIPWLRFYIVVAAIVILGIHFYLLSFILHSEDVVIQFISPKNIYQKYHGINNTRHVTTTVSLNESKQLSNTVSLLSATRIKTQQVEQPKVQVVGTFNNIPVYRTVDSTFLPKVTTVECMVSSSTSIMDQNNTNTTDWMRRTCKYTNLCYNVKERQYIAIVNDKNHLLGHDYEEQFPYVAIGGINPRWLKTTTRTTTTTRTANGYINKDMYTNINKLKWKPNRYISQQSILHNNDKDNYYFTTLDDTVVFLPFHSMAGHNVGHLVWDDLYPIYTILRLFHMIYPYNKYNIDHDSYDGTSNKQQPLQFLFLRHVLENYNTSATTTMEQLYANCDIRRNKRMQCKQNFDRFLSLFGNNNNNTNPNTFYTTKTSQFIPNNNIHTVPQSSSPIICAKTTIVGMGLYTDHGWYDHGWESSSTMSVFPTTNTTAVVSTTTKVTISKSSLPQIEVHRPPHNLGRGRLYYDFTQYLIQGSSGINTTVAKQQHQAPLVVGTEKDSNEWVPQITFSIESSRDWSRRLNFTKQIDALRSKQLQHENSRNTANQYKYKIQTYRMYERSLQEQILIANQTNIFVTVCGGGSITTTFLQRNTVVILFYVPDGGYDYYNSTLHPNHLPARLDWDLLNNAPHIRVHWLPISTMDQEEYIELFVRLIRHEIATIYRRKEFN